LQRKNIEFVNIYVILYHAITYPSKYKKWAIFVKYEMGYYNGPKAIKNWWEHATIKPTVIPTHTGCQNY
jgi:hypothetical protein